MRRVGYLCGVLGGFFVFVISATAASVADTQEAEAAQKDGTVRTDAADGWYTKQRTILKDGSVTITEREYDATDTVAHKVEFVRDADGEESMTVTKYGANGTPLTVTDLKTADGKFVELLQEQHGARRHVTFDADPVVWHVRRDDGAQYEVFAEGEWFVVQSDNVRAQTMLPLQIDDASGTLMVADTKEEYREIKLLPKEVMTRALQDMPTLGDAATMRIVRQGERIVHDISRTETKKLLGVLPLRLVRFVQYDAVRGERSAQSAPTPWIDMLSF